MWRSGSLWAVAAICVAQTPDSTLLTRVKARAAANLSTQPNYTCHETIERSTRAPGATTYKLQDTILLEVALIKGREMFSRSGASQFEEKKITDLIPTGTRGNGDFALYTRMVFLGSGPDFHYRGETTYGARRSYTFDFNVARRNSGWQVNVDEKYAYVGYKGEFHVDAETLDLQELTIESTEVPDYLETFHVIDRLEYQRIAIGTAEYLLPRSSDLTLFSPRGFENRNRTLFHGCRQYTGESTLVFDEAPDTH